MIIWTLAWVSRALLTGANLFDANMFYPATESLGWAEHHAGIAVFALPIYELTGNPVLAYWLLWLIAFPLNALAMYALAGRLTGDRVAAFGAGLVYGFCFLRMHHAHGHLQMLWTWALPLVPLALARWAQRPSLGNAALAAALVLMQALSSWYLAVVVALLSCTVTGVVLCGRRVSGGHAASAIAMLAVSIPTLAWFAAPYTRIVGGGSAEAAALSADLTGYLVPPLNTWPGQWLAAHTEVTPRWIWGEQTVYVGLTTLTLAGIGAWAAWRRRPDRLSGAVLLAGVLGFALSLGPAAGWSPFDWFSHLPGMSSLRAPARFALLVMLALAVLVAFAIRQLRSGIRRGAPAVLAMLAIIGLSESFVVDFPAGKPPRVTIPEVYYVLSTLPAGPVLSLPTYVGTPAAFRESDYLLFSTVHWLPIVNGFGRQEPPGDGATMATVARFPDATAIDRLCTLRVRYVVLHTARASELRLAARQAEAHPRISRLGRFGDDFLFGVCDAASRGD